ncbi:MAG: hypothetical protein JWO67_1859, partial [Streptosporangiaceae bacterium]|nr:hypothetical protein [Streptosporangiaceae bacterium]
SVTVSVPNTQGGHSIKARSQSAANVNSAYAPTYTLGYGQAALTSPSDGGASSSTFRVTGTAPPLGNAAGATAALQWRAAGSGGDENTGWTIDPISVPVVNNGSTGLSGTVLWDASTAAKTITGSDRLPALMDLQLCFTYSYPGGSTSKQCTWSARASSVQHVPHAFGNGFPTSGAGPGQVALWTGEVNVSATDVSVPGYTGSLSIDRSYSSLAGPNDVASGVFGPGWTAQFTGPDAGDAGLQIVDNTAVDGTLVFLAGDGSATVYRQPGNGQTQDLTGNYAPVGEDAILSGSTLSVSHVSGADGKPNTADDVLSVTMTDEDGTTTTWAPSAPYVTGQATKWTAQAVNEVGASGKTTYGWDSAGRVTRIVAPVPPVAAGQPAISCPTAGALVVGCRALDITYATTTTATATASGDYTGQVKAINLEIFDPASGPHGAMVSQPVATYTYDTTGRLSTVTDPRAALTTTYGYGSTGLLTSMKPAGLAPYRFAYTAGSAPKLAAVTRDPASEGGATSTLSSYVYGIDPTITTAGLPDLRTDSDPTTTVGVEAWGQQTPPSYGAAVFGPDHPVSTTDPTQLGAADWPYASLSYTDPLGYTVDTASYGAGAWQVGSSDYDGNGNVIRSLTPGAIAAIQAAEANLSGGATVDPDQYASITRYNVEIKNASGAVVTPAGTYVTDSWTPARMAVLGDGTVQFVRTHSHTDYDQGAPNGDVNPASGMPYRLATTVTVGTAAADAASSTPADVVPGDLATLSTTTTGYDPIDGASATGPTSGWTLGAATVTTTVMPNAADNIVHRVRFDTGGRVVESRQPGSAGGDAGTTLTDYYAAGTGSGDASCDNRPEWAGLVCLVTPAAAPSSGPTMPSTRTTGYDYLLQPTTVVETSGGTTRTTTTSYLPDGRTDTSATTVTGLSGSTAVPASRTLYDPATGAETTVENVDGTGAVIGTPIVTGHDGWGRATSYTNSQGETTTTAYDAAGRIATVTAAGHATTYGYGTDVNGAAEHRGMPTSLTIDGLGSSAAYAGAYDADGNLVTQTLPGGLQQDAAYDNVGQLTDLSYSQVSTDNSTTPATVTSTPWLAWSREYDPAGRVAREWTPDGAAFTDSTVGAAVSYDRGYSYDPAGRLVTVRDQTSGTTGSTVGTDPSADTTPCVTRTYGFDANGNRTSLLQTPADPTTGACSTATTATRSTTWASDTADRVTATTNQLTNTADSYSYDTLGRALTIPAADTPTGGGAISLGYFDTDAIQAITSNGTTETYGLDPAGRRRTSTTTDGSGTTTKTIVRHYTDGGDNPTSVDTTSGGATHTTRYTDSLSGDLGAAINDDGSIQLTLADPHGDAATTTTLPAVGATANGIDAWQSYDEYGNSLAAAPADPLGYGWLGAKQRSTDTAGTALTLMGARIYNSTTGRFTSVDPVVGGNDNAYNYPDDPINKFDVDGNCWGFHWNCWKHKIAAVGAAAGVAALIFSGPVGWTLAGIAAGASAASAYSDYRDHDYASAVLDVVGAVGFVGEGARMIRQARYAKSIGREAERLIARGTRRTIRHRVLHNMRRNYNRMVRGTARVHRLNWWAGAASVGYYGYSHRHDF